MVRRTATASAFAARFAANTTSTACRSRRQLIHRVLPRDGRGGPASRRCADRASRGHRRDLHAAGARAGFFIVNEEFKGWLTPTRDYAATKITVPVGAIGTTFSYVMRVQMLRKREPFVVKIDVEFVAEDDVPKEDVPTELKDALDRESAWKELTEKMAAAEQTYKGDVRKMLQHVRSVKKDMTRRGYSANATSDVTRMATQFEKQESEPAYRSMSAEAQHHHTQSVMRSLGAS